MCPAKEHRPTPTRTLPAGPYDTKYNMSMLVLIGHKKTVASADLMLVVVGLKLKSFDKPTLEENSRIQLLYLDSLSSTGMYTGD